MYLISFYICVFVVVFIYIDVIYVAYSFTYGNNRLGITWPLRFLQSFLLIIINAFYLPILAVLLSIFTCVSSDDGMNLFVNSIQCGSGEFYIHAPISIIFSLLFITFALFAQKTFFDTKFGSTNHLAKATSVTDVYLLLLKTICVILFTFICREENQWAMVVLMTFISGYVAYLYYDIRPYYNETVSKIYFGTCLMFLWANITLIIGKILEWTSYDGGLPLFFLGIPVILISIAFHSEDTMHSLLMSLSRFSNGDKALLQIRHYLMLIIHKDNSRNAKIKLKGYIIQYEDECILTDCPLKKYLSAIRTSDSHDSLVFLLQHAEIMYQNAIAKFPQCLRLRISYAHFLIEQLNKRRQAAFELSNASIHSPRLEEQFIIFRYTKLLEDNIPSEADSEDNMDIVSNLAYKNHLASFKSSISKAALLYIDFWSLLLNPNQDSHEDLTKLNDYGTKINILVEEITVNFNKMQKLKLNDQEVIKPYSDFLNDILNDKERAMSFKSKINDIEDTKEALDDNVLANADINTMNTSDEYQFIVASAQVDKFGVILNLSLGICGIFGYSKHELIGKVIEMIMPDILHKGHRELLTDKVNDFKKKALEINLSDMQNYKAVYSEKVTFGKNKSRYLVPLTFKTALIPIENNDIVFIAKIWNEQSSLNQMTSSPNNTLGGSVYVMTNNTFMIQNFTANAVTMLGMNSSAINNNVDITEYIKQFSEEFLKHAVENEDKTPEQKLLIKRTIVNRKFKAVTNVSWKRTTDSGNGNTEFSLPKTRHSRVNELQSTGHINENINETSLSSNHNKMMMMSRTGYASQCDDNFMLIISDLMMNNRQEGYIFKFDGIINSIGIGMTVSSTTNAIAAIKGKSTQPTSGFSENFIKMKSIKGHSDVTFNDDNSQLQLQSQHKLKVDPSFIPEPSSHPFHLDPQSLAFKQQANSKQKDLQEYLRAEAIKKINNNTGKVHKNNTDDSNASDDNESYDDSYDNSDGLPSSGMNSSSNSSSFSHNKHTPNSNVVNIISSPTNNPNLKRHLIDNYYKVDPSKIKFSIYDYSKVMPIEQHNYDKTDQVVLKMNEKQEEQADSQVHSSPLGHDYSNNHASSPSHNNHKDNRNADGNDYDNPKSKENVLIKQIEYALGKEESQPTITKMRWICFIVFLIFLVYGAGIMSIVLITLTSIKENVALITKAYDLLMYNSIGIYYCRELTLLRNENYTLLPYDSRPAYLNETFNKTLDTFINAHTLITYIITTFLSISEENSFKLFNSTLQSSIIEDNYSMSLFNLSYTSAFIEANTALFHTGHAELMNIIPTNKDVFYFLYNSLNEVAIAFESQGDILVNELSLKVATIKTQYAIIISVMLAVGIGLYFLLSWGYDGIARRKESYLEVFFEIGNNVIKGSLEKCENFTKKIQTESVHDSISTSEENDLGEDSRILPNGKGSMNEKGREHRGNNGRRGNNTSREAKIIKAKFAIILVLIGLFIVLSFVFYIIYLGTVLMFMEFYKNQSDLDNEFLMLFNGLREYMFDQNTKVFRNDSLLYVNNALEGIYMKKQEKTKFLNLHIRNIPSAYSSALMAVYKDSACSINSYFKTKKDCEDFMSNSTEYGLEIALTYFIEEIRDLKNNAEIFRHNQSLTGEEYNLTYTGTLKGISLWPTDPIKLAIYAKHDSIHLFNDNQVHLKLNIMFLYIIYPNFKELTINLRNAYDVSLSRIELIYIILVSIYLGLVLTGYVIVWIPYETKMNQTIYKTKNMLSIIPKEVLASLGNIHKLLNINQNAGKNTMMRKTI